MEPVTGLLIASTAMSVFGGISEAKAKKRAAEAEAAQRRLQAKEFRRRTEQNLKLQERQGQYAILNAAATRQVGLAGYTKENQELDYREFSTLEDVLQKARVDADYEEQLILSGARAKDQEASDAYSGVFMNSASTILSSAYKYQVAKGNKPSQNSIF